MEFQIRAMSLVVAYFNTMKEKTDTYELKVEDVYVVWFCKTLQNWKCLISTTVPDGMYYEVTYNGDLKETYIDAYKKFNNMVFHDDPEPGQDPIPGVNVDWVTTETIKTGFGG